jgi:ABC-type transport system involved in cytochrome bd biosynthesis fused ATPase/permease subunit
MATLYLVLLLVISPLLGVLALGLGVVQVIAGPSGSGKSTLARLLLGLYEPDAGSIRYDGTDLRELEARSVRRQLGIVTQGCYVFGTSVRYRGLFSAQLQPSGARPDRVDVAPTRLGPGRCHIDPVTGSLGAGG